MRSGAYPVRYDAIIIDEAQDLDPTVLRMMVGLCREPGRIFVTADANQSIYGSSFRWTDVHADLRFQGRTGVLRKNYRSTREIGEGAQSYLKAGALDNDLIERSYTQSGGPLPAVRKVSQPHAEAQPLAQFLKVAARDARMGIGSCAVLVPTEGAGRAIADRLSVHGVRAKFIPGRELDLQDPAVKVITLQSAIWMLAGMIDSRTASPGENAPHGCGIQANPRSVSPASGD